MRCSGRPLSSRRLQELQAAPGGFDQQAAHRLRAAADRKRYALTDVRVRVEQRKRFLLPRRGTLY